MAEENNVDGEVSASLPAHLEILTDAAEYSQRLYYLDSSPSVEAMVGDRFSIRDANGELLDNLVILKKGDDLEIYFLDVHRVIIKGYFKVCVDDQCSITVASDVPDGISLSEDDFLTNQAQAAEAVLYYHGDDTSSLFRTLADNNPGVTELESLAIQENTSDEQGFVFTPLLGLTGGGLGLVGAAAGAGSDSSSDSPSESPAESINTPPVITIDTVAHFVQDAAENAVGSLVTSFTTFDAEGASVRVLLSDTTHYALTDSFGGSGSVVLTQAGLLLVTEGLELPAFTLTPNDGAQNGLVVTANPEVIAVDDPPVTVDPTLNTPPVLTLEASNNFVEDAPENVVGSIVANYTVADRESEVIEVILSDTIHYALDGASNVVLTARGLAAVNSGSNLPIFTLTPVDSGEVGESVKVEPIVTPVNDLPVLLLTSVIDFVEQAITTGAGSAVASFSVSDEEGAAVSVTLSDLTHYALDGNGNVILLSAGAALVDAGQDLPVFTLTPNDGTQDGFPVIVDPSVTLINDAPRLYITTSNDFIEDDFSNAIGSVVASYTILDEDDTNVVALLSDTAHYALDDAGNVTLTSAGLTLVNSGNDLPAFTLTPSDGWELGMPVMVNPSVVPINDAPGLNVSVSNFVEDAASNRVGSIVVSYTAYDEDGDEVNVTLSDTSYYVLDGAGNVTLLEAGLELVNKGAELPSFTLTANDGVLIGDSVVVRPSVIPVNDLPLLDLISTVDFFQNAAANAVGSIVASYTTSDEEGETVRVKLSDTVNYGLDGEGNVALTAIGLGLVNGGTALPQFTLTPNDGIEDGLPVTAAPLLTTVNSLPILNVVAITDFIENAARNVIGSVVASYTTFDAEGSNVNVALSDSTNYSLDGEGNVVLTGTGLRLVNEGAELPQFTLTPSDEGGAGSPVSVAPLVTQVNDLPRLNVIFSADFTTGDASYQVGSVVASIVTSDPEGATVLVALSDTTHYEIEDIGDSSYDVTLTAIGLNLVRAGVDLPPFTLTPNDGEDDGIPLTLDPSVNVVNNLPVLQLIASNDFIQGAAGNEVDSIVATYVTLDEEGSVVEVTLSDTTHYRLDNAGNVRLTAVGFGLVNAGTDLPAFTLTPNDGKENGLPVLVDPLSGPNLAPSISVTANGFVQDAIGLVAGVTVAGTYTTSAPDLADTLSVRFTSSGQTDYALVGGQVVLTQAGIDKINSGNPLPPIDLTVTDNSPTQPLSSSDSDTPVVTIPTVEGFSLIGDPRGSSGHSVSNAGDVNGDGFADFIIGDPWTNSLDGTSYVVFGGPANGAPESLDDIAQGTGIRGGFRIRQENVLGFATAGFGVSGAGDVNGDGLADLMVAVPAHTVNNEFTGVSYVVFGKTTNAEVNLTDVANGLGGFAVYGTFIENLRPDVLRTAIAGDVNGDGLSDLILANRHHSAIADGASKAGVTYIIYGKTDGASISLDDFVQEGNPAGYAISGARANDESGNSVSPAGDFNGDGIDDVLIFAPYSDISGRDLGSYYVVFGKPSGSQNVDLHTIELGASSEGVLIKFQPSSGGGLYSGLQNTSVAAAGDVNGDGIADVILGAHSSRDAPAGKSYVVFGGDVGGVIELAKVEQGIGGFVIFGANVNSDSGFSVSGAGDVNGDGLADIVVGAPAADARNDGTVIHSSYVVFGKSDGTPVELSDVANGVGGFEFARLSSIGSGFSVSGGGDINGDGFDDVLSGSHRGDNAFNAPRVSTVVFGGQGSTAVREAVVTDTLVGDAGANQLVAGRGSDLVIGNGGADVLRGGHGDDILVISDASFASLSGGLGLDTLRFDRSFDLNLQNIGNTRLSGIEIVDLNGTGSTLTLGNDDILTMVGDEAANRLIVSGASSDSVVFGQAGFSLVFGPSSEMLDGIEYDVYRNPAMHQSVSVYIQEGIEVDAFPSLFVTAITDFVEDAASNTEGSIVASYTTSARGDAIFLVTLSDTTHYRIDGIGNVVLTRDGLDLVNLGRELPAFTLTPSDGTQIGTAITVDPSVTSANDVPTIIVTANDFNEGQTGLLAGVSVAGTYVTDDGADGDVLTVAFTSTEQTHYALVDEEVVLTQLGIDAINLGNPLSPIDLTVTDDNETQPLFSSGSDTPFVTPISGFSINGVSPNGGSGFSVSGAGDVNGDGFADIVLGAHKTDGFKGESYVVFGGPSSSSPESLAAIASGTSARGGFRIRNSDSTALEAVGLSVSDAGDVNGDGFADFIVGAPNGSTIDAKSGDSFVVFGKPTNGDVDLANIKNGEGGFAIYGFGVGSYFNTASVSAAGDVNGDGLADLIVGVPTKNGTEAPDYSGVSYVVYGKADGEPVLLSGLSQNSSLDGFAIVGVDSRDSSGFSVSGVGDFNDDGYDDVIVWSPNSDSVAESYGAYYLVFGKASNSRSIDLSQIESGTSNDGLFIQPSVNPGPDFDGSRFSIAPSTAVSAAGDVNGDGIADVIVGAYSHPDAPAGKSYVLFGRNSAAAIDLADVELGVGGFVINGSLSGQLSGFSVSGAGDINGDGLGDIIVGAPADEINGIASGSSYVVFGKIDGAPVDLASVKSGIGGFVVAGVGLTARSGTSVSGAGDVNGDGLADIVVGSPLHDANGVFGSGMTEVVFGSAGEMATVGTTGPDTLVGDTGANQLVAGRGNDLLIGNGGADILRGGEGNDILAITDTNFASLAGGLGIDTLRIDRELDFDLRQIGNTRLDGLEIIDLNGSGTKLTLGNDDILSIVGDEAANRLVVNGTTADAVVFAQTGFTQNLGATGTVDGVTYNIFTNPIFHESVRVYVQQGIATTGATALVPTLTLTAKTDFTEDVPGNMAGSVVASYSIAAAGGMTIDVMLSDTTHYALDGANNVTLTTAGLSLVNAGIDLPEFTLTLNGGAPLTADPSVVPVNDLPTITITSSTRFTQNAETNSIGSVAASFTTFDEESLEVNVVLSDLTHYALDGNGNVTLTVGGLERVNAGLELPPFTLTPNDGLEDGTSETVSPTVVPVNNAPTIKVTANEIKNDASELVAGVSVAGTYVTSDGGDGDVLTVSFTSSEQTHYALIGGQVVLTQAGIDTITSGNALDAIDLTVSDDNSVLALSSSDSDTPLILIAGFSIAGISDDSYSGWSLSAGGDINGDGFSDVIVGTPLSGSANEGVTYVVFGSPGGTAREQLADIAAGTSDRGGFVIRGSTELGFSAWSVNNAGDVNGDGLADIIIGAPAEDTRGVTSGASYVVFGKSTNTEVSLAAIERGIGGFTIYGGGDGVPSLSGDRVSGAGDVNGDGLADLIVGARGSLSNPKGASYVVYGSADGAAISLVDIALDDNTQGFVIAGSSYEGRLDFSLSGSGDFNGDGFDDLIVSSLQSDSVPGGYGADYIIFGKAADGQSVDLSLIESGVSTDGVFIRPATSAEPGLNEASVSIVPPSTVSAAGDVNGDGISDVIIGTFSHPDALAGKSYVVFGRSSIDTIELSDVEMGIGGFVINGDLDGHRSGYSVSGAGDINGDGLADIIIGAPDDVVGGIQTGSSFIVFGKSDGAPVDLRDVRGNLGGFVVEGLALDDLSGSSVSGGGDINGDGFSDVISGAPQNSAGGIVSEGLTTVLFGGQSTLANVGTSLSDILTGDEHANQLVAGRGNDIILGNGGADVLRGGAGDDLLAITDSSFASLSGGLGTDTLRLDQALDLDLRQIGNTRLSGLEIIDLNNSGSTLTLGNDDVLTMVGDEAANRLIIRGSASDAVFLQEEFVNANGALEILDSVIYHVYTNPEMHTSVRVFIQQNILVSALASDSPSLTVTATTDFTEDAIGNAVGSVAASYVLADGAEHKEVELSDSTHYALDGAGNVTITAAGLALINKGIALPTFTLTPNQNSVAGEPMAVSPRVTQVNDLPVLTLTDTTSFTEDAQGNAVGSVVARFTTTDEEGADIAITLSDTRHYALDGKGNVTLTANGLSLVNAGDDLPPFTLTLNDGFDNGVPETIDPTVTSVDDLPVLNVYARNDFVEDASSNAVGSIVARFTTSDEEATDVTVTLSDTIHYSLDTDTGKETVHVVLTEAGLALVTAGIDLPEFSVTPNDGTNDGEPVLIDPMVVQANDAPSIHVFANDFIAGSENLIPEVSIAATYTTDDGGDGDNLIVTFSSAAQTHYALMNEQVVLTQAGIDAINSGGPLEAIDLTVTDDDDRRPLSSSASDTPTVAAADIDGFSLFGGSAGDRSGWSVSDAGDVNGDGYADIIVGATRANVGGTSYVVFGGRGGATEGQLSSFPSSVDNRDGFRILGLASPDDAGHSVSGAGDVNGDGLDDLIIGAPNSDSAGSSSGSSYVVFGKTTNADVNLADIVSGIGGFAVFGESGSLSTNSGYSVSGAGDFNGDGFADFIIGTNLSGTDRVANLGTSYVVFGKPDGAAISLSDVKLDNNASGFVINGANLGDRSGYSVSGAGDFNGDGFDDVMVWSPGSDRAGEDNGAYYVIFGNNSMGQSVDLLAIEAGTSSEGVLINPVTSSSGSRQVTSNPSAVSAAGDVNGDGIDDVIVGAYNRLDARDGKSYVVFGRSTPGTIELSNVEQGVGGFVINGASTGSASGFSVAGAGDVNGDGLADIIVGDPDEKSGRFQTGGSYIVFGKTDGTPIELGSIGDGGLFLGGLERSDESGSSVSSAGDVNGDGFDDVVVGAFGHNADRVLDSGLTTVFFGGQDRSTTINTFAQGGAGDDKLEGNTDANQLIGGSGNDELVGNGGADVLRGGAGDDILAVSDDGFADIVGGNGIDTLRLDSALNLDFSSLRPASLSSIEQIDLTLDSGNSHLEFNLSDVLQLSEATNELRIFGESGDSVNLENLSNGPEGAWQASNERGLNAFEFTSVGGDILATVLIDEEVITSVI